MGFALPKPGELLGKIPDEIIGGLAKGRRYSATELR